VSGPLRAQTLADGTGEEPIRIGTDLTLPCTRDGWHSECMATFITIGYGDQAGYDRTPDPLRQAAHTHDETLQDAGVLMGRAGDPVQVRNPEATGVVTTPGPFLRSDLPVAGFAVLEADSLTEAIEKASQSPCAIAHGVIEVWPLNS
jgi:hypothetical protein